MFLADDTLRPPALITYDLKGNYERVFQILDGVINPAQSDVASDTDNTWTDGANVDAHAYVGFTYDYYFQRFGRRCLDGNNHAIRSIVHPANREDPLSLPDVVIDNSGVTGEWRGMHEGHEATRRMFAMFIEPWERVRLEVEGLTDGPDGIVAEMWDHERGDPIVVVTGGRKGVENRELQAVVGLDVRRARRPCRIWLELRGRATWRWLFPRIGRHFGDRSQRGRPPRPMRDAVERHGYDSRSLI